MNAMAQGFQRFSREVFPARAALFEELATTHRPTALFIGCSDARVVPELITQSDPGELFVIRTAGNLVPPYTRGPDGVAASIEYAVDVLGVADVVVCGHSACGAMTALASGGDLTALPAVTTWLHHADASMARTGAGGHPAGPERVAALVKDNVLAQLANLRTHPSVAKALVQRKVTLHGWVYDIGSGSAETLDTETGRFTALAG
ncbi:carbonic anhydrase [Streptomyces sp. NPDC001380]|uniref:carbonic anhydrase n=1 Tax=Streptomyces sp. NPDC001380 TaxID=3364566 RepID=UPI0036913288